MNRDSKAAQPSVAAPSSVDPTVVDKPNPPREPGAPDVAPIRVGFVVHVMQVAGAEMLVSEAVRRLAGTIVPTVFCLDSVGQLGEQLRGDGFDVVCFDRSPGLDMRLPWRLSREVRARKIEVLHAHQYTPFFYSALAKLVPGRSPRIILTEHGRHYPDVVSAKRRWTNRIVLKRFADAVNACCDFSRQALAELDGFPADRIEVIENGIQLDRYGPIEDRGPLRARLGLDPGRRYVAMIGRLHSIKDPTTLVRGFAPVAAARDDTDLLLVGDGPLRSDLESLAESLGIKNRVRFLGIRSDVPDILRAVDLFALTSVSEAASLTLMEAMASALPVVVTEVGGNPEIVRPGIEGMLVPREDFDATAQALLALLAGPERARAMGQAGRRRVEEKYRLERTIDAYLGLYRRLCR